MEKINLLKYKQKSSNITSERQLIIKDFLDILNSERINYPKIKAGRLANMFTGINNSDLKSFYGSCKYSKNFSKYFWWSFKKKD